MIGFQVRNDSGQTVTLEAGEKKVTLGAGETAAMKLPEGAQLLTVSGTPHLQAGAVVTTVTGDLKGSTLSIS